MKTILLTQDLRIYMDVSALDFCSRRAANPKSVCEPCNNEIPKSLDKLATSKVGSGHDCFLSGIFVYFDWNVNKIIREQLLRYNFINVISSQSLMHKAEELLDCTDAWDDIDIEMKRQLESLSKNYRLTPEELANNIPLGFKYWLSFCCNYRQLKTIYSQRKNHKRSEWRKFCEALKELPNSHWIVENKE